MKSEIWDVSEFYTGFNVLLLGFFVKPFIEWRVEFASLYDDFSIYSGMVCLQFGEFEFSSDKVSIFSYFAAFFKLWTMALNL